MSDKESIILDFDGEWMKMTNPGWNSPHSAIQCPHCHAKSSEFKWNVATKEVFATPGFDDYDFTRIQQIDTHDPDTGFACPQCLEVSTSSELGLLPAGYVLLTSFNEIKEYMSDDKVTVYIRFEGATKLLSTDEHYAFATASPRAIIMANYFVKVADYRGSKSKSGDHS